MSSTPTSQKTTVLPVILSQKESEILSEWIKNMSGATRRSDLIKESDLRVQCSQLLGLTQRALEQVGTNFQASAWDGTREVAWRGFARPRPAGLYSYRNGHVRLLAEATSVCSAPAGLQGRRGSPATETWAATELLDSMGLYTTEVYQKSREEVIKRQQEELLELSTPVVKLWDGILALPIIGTWIAPARRL